jgi:hypothetical protein
MSVLECGRSGCDAVMCDRLILDSSTYLCDNCWKELLEHKKTWPKDARTSDVYVFLRKFVRSPPGTHLPATPEDIEREFKRLTGQS